MIVVSAPFIANGFAVGAALLALWIAVRFPGRSPSLSAAFALAGCSQVLLLLSRQVTAAAEWMAGPAFALLAVVLPLFTFAFWSGLCLGRALLARRA